MAQTRLVVQELMATAEVLPDEQIREVTDFAVFLSQRYPREKANSRRRPGSAKGLIRMSEDFDAPLDDFNEYK